MPLLESRLRLVAGDPEVARIVVDDAAGGAGADAGAAVDAPGRAGDVPGGVGGEEEDDGRALSARAGRARGRVGMRRPNPSAIVGGSGFGWVSMRPGLTVLTRMLCGASSMAATREKASVAARLAA